MGLALDIIIAFIVLIIVIILLSGIKVVNEWERLPVLVLGRFTGLKGPGIIYVPPIIGKVPMRISTRLQAISFRTEQSLTKDNVPVIVDAVMYYQPVDLEKVVLKVEDYNVATRLAAETTLREVIGQTMLDELLAERDKVAALARNIIDSKTETWGVKVTAVEIRNVEIPPDLVQAMSRQAQAERERRARVTLAQAEYEAAQKMVEAANLYVNNDRAFMLRWMNMIYELGMEGKNMLVFIPANLPIAGPPTSGSMSPVGIMGVKDLVVSEEKKQEGQQGQGK
ncbi:MAG: SPFH domain-containing protein [Acidilobus sp.]